MFGLSGHKQNLCFALALWNGRDPILEERMFGLTNSEGNHGEDVKELYYYLDATPTHSYLKGLYKYPQREFPYGRLVEENRRRSKDEPEFELLDTGVFDDGRYFDVFVEYAKQTPDDVCIRVTVHNRGPEASELHVLPHLWFRNTWSWGAPVQKPGMALDSKAGAVVALSPEIGSYHLYAEETRRGSSPRTTATSGGCTATPAPRGSSRTRSMTAWCTAMAGRSIRIPAARRRLRTTS